MTLAHLLEDVLDDSPGMGFGCLAVLTGLVGSVVSLAFAVDDTCCQFAGYGRNQLIHECLVEPGGVVELNLNQLSFLLFFVLLREMDSKIPTIGCTLTDGQGKLFAAHDYPSPDCYTLDCRQEHDRLYGLVMYLLLCMAKPHFLFRMPVICYRPDSGCVCDVSVTGSAPTSSEGVVTVSGIQMQLLIQRVIHHATMTMRHGKMPGNQVVDNAISFLTWQVRTGSEPAVRKAAYPKGHHQSVARLRFGYRTATGTCTPVHSPGSVVTI